VEISHHSAQADQKKNKIDRGQKSLKQSQGEVRLTVTVYIGKYGKI
jgi:hypothetical protein